MKESDLRLFVYFRISGNVSTSAPWPPYTTYPPFSEYTRIDNREPACKKALVKLTWRKLRTWVYLRLSLARHWVDWFTLTCDDLRSIWSRSNLHASRVTSNNFLLANEIQHRSAFECLFATCSSEETCESLWPPKHKSLVELFRLRTSPFGHPNTNLWLNRSGYFRVLLVTQTQISGWTVQFTSESVWLFSNNDGDAEDDTHSERWIFILPAKFAIV